MLKKISASIIIAIILANEVQAETSELDYAEDYEISYLTNEDWPEDIEMTLYSNDYPLGN